LHRDEETLTQTECLPAIPSAVFRALTEPDVQAAWAGAQASGTSAAGNSFTMFNEFISGRYLDLQPNRRILAEWRTAEWPRDFPSSVVEITLEEKGEATEIILVQSMIPPGLSETVKGDWINRYWRPLRAYFEKIKHDE
jgi:uncharacterized protein YndB with AHSA1/START domain